jgi:hypothetical protein
MLRNAVSAILAIGLLAGCSKQSNPTAAGEQTFQSDEEYLRFAVLSSDSVADFTISTSSTIDDDGDRPFEYSEGFGSVTDPITPLRWGRRVTSVTRDVQIAIQGDSLAVATVTKTIAGTLFIRATRDSGGVVDTVLVEKPFSDTAIRKILFRRVARTERFRLNWAPVAITPVDGRSPTNDFEIVELQFMTPRDTFVISDPLSTWIRFGFHRERGELPRVRPNEPVRVRVTVTSQNDSSEIAMLRWGVGFGDGRHHRARIPLVQSQNSGGVHIRVYERVFLSHQHYGRFNAVVDVLSYATLYDDTASYSNRFWGMPYHLMLF